MQQQEYDRKELAGRLRKLIASTFSPGEPLNKSMFVCVGIVLPAICFALVFLGPPDGPTWQSGNLRDLAKLMLGGPAHRASYPLLLYSMTSMGLFILRPKSTQLLVVRIGLYAAVPTTCVYGWVLAISMTGLSDTSNVDAFVAAFAFAVIATGSLFVIWGTIRLLCMTLFEESTWFPSIVLISVIVVGGLASGVVAVAILGTLAAAPFWCLAVYSIASFSVMKEQRHQKSFSLFNMGALLTAIAGHLATWRHTVDQALRIYAELPTEPPEQCFIATAAARGHQRFVGARPSPNAARCISHQLVLLKSGEIAIKTLAPKVHRFLRIIYDRVGPTLAARIRNPWLADVVFVLLKPAEIATSLALHMLGVDRGLVRRVYAGTRDHEL